MFSRLLAIFICVPLIETLLFIKIGSQIGIATTIAVVILTGFLGAWLTKQQGLRTWQKFQKTSASGQLPANEVIDGLLILIAGAVLLTPGFLTDIIGFLLLVPGFRTLIRGSVAGKLKNKVTVAGASPFQPRPAPQSGGERVAKGRVIDSTPSE